MSDRPRKPYTFRMPIDQQEAIDQEAKRDGITRTEWMVRALDAQLGRPRGDAPRPNMEDGSSRRAPVPRRHLPAVRPTDVQPRFKGGK
jgi:hypothetical protein